MIREEYIVDLSILDEEIESIRVDKYLTEVCEDLSRSEIKGYFDESELNSLYYHKRVNDYI